MRRGRQKLDLHYEPINRLGIPIHTHTHTHTHTVTHTLTHTHTHARTHARTQCDTHILIPFEDRKPTGLKVDIAHRNKIPDIDTNGVLTCR